MYHTKIVRVFYSTNCDNCIFKKQKSNLSQIISSNGFYMLITVRLKNIIAIIVSTFLQMYNAGKHLTLCTIFIMKGGKTYSDNITK